MENRLQNESTNLYTRQVLLTALLLFVFHSLPNTFCCILYWDVYNDFD